jgi:hypothetical protein
MRSRPLRIEVQLPVWGSGEGSWAGIAYVGLLGYVRLSRFAQ